LAFDQFEFVCQLLVNDFGSYVVALLIVRWSECLASTSYVLYCFGVLTAVPAFIRLLQVLKYEPLVIVGRNDLVCIATRNPSVSGNIWPEPEESANKEYDFGNIRVDKVQINGTFEKYPILLVRISLLFS
ncbi:unnamed protein product, partial [Acanthoscelides obtectus]